MAIKISNASELFRRFRACELHVKQGKIASCLISFKDIVDRLPAIPMTEKEKKEIHKNIEDFLENLSSHKKFKEIFGDFTFADTDLATNLEFIKSMIIAQEEEIVQRIEKDEEAAQAQRLEVIKAEEARKEELKLKIQDAIALIDDGNLSEATGIIKESNEIQAGVLEHYNALGIQSREEKNYEEAIKNYSKAMTVAPDDEYLHYNIARAYFEYGKHDKAENYLEKAVQLNPDFTEGKVLLTYLVKLDDLKKQAQAKAKTVNGNVSEKKPGGFLEKLFGSKKGNVLVDYLAKLNSLSKPDKAKAVNNKVSEKK